MDVKPSMPEGLSGPRFRGDTMRSGKILHKFMSPLLHKSGTYARWWRQRAHQNPFTIVLCYHRVVSNDAQRAGRFYIERGVSADIFESQIRFMLKHFAPINASQVLEPSSENIRFAVTLDDGYEDNYRVAAPILRRMGVTATFFVVTEFVGSDRVFWWEQFADMIRATRVPEFDLQATIPELVGCEGLAPLLSLQTWGEREIVYERLCAAMRARDHETLIRYVKHLSEVLEVRPREEGRDYGLMSWEHLRELTRQGFEIGCHTATHRNMVDVDERIVQKEITTSFSKIEQQLEVPAITFAYPYGHFEKSKDSLSNSLKAAGCRVAFVGVTGVVEVKNNAFELPRTQLNRKYHFACGFNIQDTLNQSKRFP